MNDELPRTELQNEKNIYIDQINIKDALTLMIRDQSEVMSAIQKSSVQIETVIEKIYNTIKDNDDGRIFYAGAGTSARIGVQDGVELYPTFGWPKKRIGFLVAGGPKALLSPIENAEDDIVSPRKLIKKLKLTKNDVLICLAASGNTPFTNAIFSEASEYRSLVVGISNNPDGKIIKNCQYPIILDTGPEIVVGSTRLKAGTAQKICLNLISTIVMSKLGRVKNGQMSHMVATNHKLRKRKSRIKHFLIEQG